MKRDYNDYDTPTFYTEDHHSGNLKGPYELVENSHSVSSSFGLGGSYMLDSGFAGLSFSRYENDYGVPGEHADSDTLIEMESDRFEFRSEIDISDSDWLTGIDFNIGYGDYKHSEGGYETEKDSNISAKKLVYTFHFLRLFMLKHVEIQDKTNNRWKRFFEHRCLTLKADPIVKPEDKIFTMGSCFAREIKYSLERRGINVGPNYASIPQDKYRYRIDELPENNHLNFYNTYTVLQEFERLADRWVQARDDYWAISRKQFANQECYQDPYRRLTFGSTPENLFEANEHISSVIRDAANMASVFLFTFGVTEIFQLKSNGRIAGQKPAHFGGGGVSESELYLSTFGENFENLVKLREIVKVINPNAKASCGCGESFAV